MQKLAVKNYKLMFEHMNLKELERIICEHQDGLFRFAFFRTGSLSDSQDIVQSVFLRMYERKSDLSKVENLKNYLYRSISNSCLDYLRKKQRIKAQPLDSVVMAAEENESDEITREYLRIREMMESIPEEQANIILMRTVDGLAFTEIAEILSISVSTVKSRFKYGIDKLKLKSISRRN